jgi:transcriptional regulator with XRE-family HTH domain
MPYNITVSYLKGRLWKLEWLKAIRAAKGLKQSEVATLTGISQATYCNIENEERRPSPETAIKIGRCLEFDWTRFYESVPTPSEPPTE